MEILVTGVKGQLGYDICRVLEKREIPFVGASREDFNITDRAETSGFIRAVQPDLVIHCAAYTAVERAEDDPETCRRVNSDGTRNIAEACAMLGTRMMYISTDYVFPGTGEKSYETDDPKGPLNVYGQTKLEGENAVREVFPDGHCIVRVSWVCGVNGANFVKAILRLAEKNTKLNVVSDQIGSPTFTMDLAPLLCDMAAAGATGTFHATNEGMCSWADFSDAIFRMAGKRVNVNHIPTSEYPTRAKRPLNSRMSKASLDAAGFTRLPAWEDSLKIFIKELC